MLADANESRDWRIYADFALNSTAILDRNRPVPVDLFLGALSLDQGDSEDTHLARLARQHSQLHSHFRR